MNQGNDIHMTRLLIGMGIMIIILVAGMILAKHFKVKTSPKDTSEWDDINTLKATHPEIAAQIEAAQAKKAKEESVNIKEGE